MFESLSAAVDEVVRDGPPPHPGGERLDALQRQRNRLDYAMACEVAAFDRERVWSADGAYDAVAWIATTLLIPRREAATLVRVGRALADMPATAAAWAAGDIGLAQAQLLASVRRDHTAEAFARDEADLVADAARLTVRQLRCTLRAWDERHDPDRAAQRADQQYDDRAVHLSQSFEDQWFLDGTLEPIGGLIVADELRRLERMLFRQDWKEAKQRLGRRPHLDELARTPAQRRHDALVEMAIRSRSTPKGARRPEPLFVVIVDLEQFRAICELHNRRLAPAAALTRWLSKAWVERVVFDSPSRPIDVGRRRRLFSKAQADAIRARDLECAHPKCDRPAIDCEIDHTIPWSEGGETVERNGRALCRFHNLRRLRRTQDRARRGRRER